MLNKNSDASVSLDLQQIRTLVADVLTPHASAILLDPEYGLPAAKQRHGKGLFLAYEKTGYDVTTPGRLPDLLDHWSVNRVKEAGADCVKALMYYTPFEEASINEHRSVCVERIGAECRALNIAFFLELVGYDTEGSGEHSLSYARRKPRIVRNSAIEFRSLVMRGCAQGRDTSRLGVCGRGTQSFRGEKAYNRSEALQHFRSAVDGISLPFIYLSGRVSHSVFVESLALAGESGVPYSGVLCDRATWKDGIATYAQHGSEAFNEWLKSGRSPEHRKSQRNASISDALEEESRSLSRIISGIAIQAATLDEER